MKKTFFIIIAVIVCIFVLSRFTNKEPHEIETNYTNTETDNSNKDESPALSFDYSEIHLVHSPSDLIKISITYPQFKDERLSDANEIIAEYAKADFLNIINEDDVDNLELTLEEKHSIKLATNELISISSDGELNVKGAAHPSAIKSSLNIHPLDLRKFKISELINISDEFIQVFKEISSSNEQLNAYLSSFSDEEIKDKVSGSKMYFDDKDVIIIFEVPHALGDFVEIKFDEEQITPYL